MAAHLDPARRYRLGQARPGETRFQVVVGETDLHILAARDLSVQAEQTVRALRADIQNHILLHPEFQTNLTPLTVPAAAPRIVRAMAEAAARFDVGPMAAVAGAIAEGVARALTCESPDVLVENGGDVFACSTRERIIGLLAEPNQGVRLGLRFATEEFPVALCTSSGRIGHSLSFGRGDVLVVRSASGAVADAAATALANRLRDGNDLQRVLNTAQAWEERGVDGVFAQCGGQIAAWGNMELAVVE